MAASEDRFESPTHQPWPTRTAPTAARRRCVQPDSRWCPPRPPTPWFPASPDHSAPDPACHRPDTPTIEKPHVSQTFISETVTSTETDTGTERAAEVFKNPSRNQRLGTGLFRRVLGRPEWVEGWVGRLAPRAQILQP